MNTLKVRVENGKIVGEAPAGLPEGTELELCVADPGDAMSPEELAALNRTLDAAWGSIEAGRFRAAECVIEDLRKAR